VRTGQGASRNTASVTEAQEQPFEPSPAVRAHHNQIGFLREGLIDDRRLWIA